MPSPRNVDLFSNDDVINWNGETDDFKETILPRNYHLFPNFSRENYLLGKQIFWGNSLVGCFCTRKLYSFVAGVLFLVLNSQYYEDHSQVEDEYTQQELWLHQQLELVKTKQCQHCVVFQHIPWFLKDANEEKDYFNIEINTRLRMLNKLRDAGIRHIFCGHYHRNAGGFYGDLELVVTSAVGCQIGNDVSGMRLVKVTKEKIEHKYYGVEDENFPKEIDLDGDSKLP